MNKEVSDKDVELMLVPRPFKVQTSAGASLGYPNLSDPEEKLVDSDAAIGLDNLKDWQETEACRVDISAERSTISARGDAGFRRGRAILQQLSVSGRQLQLPLTIIDRPQYRWRGLSVDVARNFFGVKTIITVMSLMEGLSLNTLHLHLSDDQGWRLEVPEMPELAGRSSNTASGGGPGGYFSVKDMQTLLREAKKRGISVVPEIDIPGHTTAALHALPGLNLDGKTVPAFTGTDGVAASLRVGAPQTREFLQTVLAAAASWATNDIHIGGDEAASTPKEEYRKLVEWSLEEVHKSGRPALAWQEAADLLKSGDTVQFWDERIDTTGVARAADRGVGIIMSPAPRTYLDMKYSKESKLGQTWMGTGDLQNSLEWSPEKLVAGVSGDAITGVEACIWTELISTPQDFFDMLLPRLAAVAEVAWTGNGEGQWESFSRRIKAQALLWLGMGLDWHRSEGVDWPVI